MRVFIQRSQDGLFLKTESVWVSAKDEAKPFDNCTPAIDFCVERGIKDVRLCLSFGDTKYDLFLEVFRAETQTLVRFSQKLRAEREELLRRLDSQQTERQGRTKQMGRFQKPLVPDTLA